MPSPSASVSGQPLFSTGPAVPGHLSFASSTPSLSLSGSGQPSSSWKPSLSSGWSLHLSVKSSRPSASVSGTVSGQPSWSSHLLTVSGWSGHLSSLSGMPSPSLSLVGQPSALPFPASFGHRSAAPTTPSLSGSGSSCLAAVFFSDGLGLNDTPKLNSP